MRVNFTCEIEFELTPAELNQMCLPECAGDDDCACNTICFRVLEQWITNNKDCRKVAYYGSTIRLEEEE